MAKDIVLMSVIKLVSEKGERRTNVGTVQLRLDKKSIKLNRNGIAFIKKSKSDRPTNPVKKYGITGSSENAEHACCICGSKLKCAWRIRNEDLVSWSGVSLRIASRGGYAFDRNTG